MYNINFINIIMKKSLYIPLSLFIILTLGSCVKTRKEVDLGSISKFTWRLISWEENKVDKNLYPDGLPFIKFTREGIFSGSTGCNAFNTNIVIEGSDINTSGGLISQVGCSKEKMEIEGKIAYGIFQSNKLYQEGNTLIFMLDDKELLRYKK